MKYAIIESGGKQYKAVEGGTIEVDRLPVETGQDVALESVLLMVEEEQVTVGMPTIKGMSVKAKVLEHFKGEKVVFFRYRPKKRIRVKAGHRQQYTRLQIEQVGNTKTPKTVKASEAIPNEQPVVEMAAVKPAKAAKTEKKPSAPKKATPAAKKSQTPSKTTKTSKTNKK